MHKTWTIRIYSPAKSLGHNQGLRLTTSSRLLTTKDQAPDKHKNDSDLKNEKIVNKKPKKTMQQLDDEMRAAMENRAGDGGISGAELEGGKAVSMKRGKHSVAL